MRPDLFPKDPAFFENGNVFSQDDPKSAWIVLQHLEEATEILKSLLGWSPAGPPILVGHALSNDFKWLNFGNDDNLKWFVDNHFDSQILYSRDNPTPGLALLVEQQFGHNLKLQRDTTGVHDCGEDAAYALALVIKGIPNPIHPMHHEFLLFEKNKENIVNQILRRIPALLTIEQQIKDAQALAASRNI